MEFKTEPLRKKSGLGFLKIILLAMFICLVLHFLFTRRREVVEDFDKYIRPYFQFQPEKDYIVPKWIPKGDVLPLRTDKLDSKNRPHQAVVVIASGGVGNQLFMYAAGYAFARSLGLPLFVSPANPGNYDFGIFPEPHPNTLVREFLLHHFNLPSHQLIKYDTMQGYVEAKLEKKPEVVDGKNVIVDVKNIDEFNFHNTVDENYVSNGYGLGNFKRAPPPERRVVYLLKHNFQSHLFFDGFEEEIREIFNLDGYVNSRMALTNYYLQDLLKDVKATDSVAMHVRRGDFLLANSEYTPIPWKYFERAMEQIKLGKLPTALSTEHPKLHFFVFSDSIDLVRKEFEERGLSKYGGVTFVRNGDGMTNLKELYLMTACNDFVLPNSVFSWWAAFLNTREHKTVIAPYPRFTSKDYAANPRRQMLDDMFPIYPPAWLLINPWEISI